MKSSSFFTLLLLLASCSNNDQSSIVSSQYPIDPVPFTSVKVDGGFWGQRLQASREVTVPLAFSKCEETGRYRNFENAAHPSDTIQVGGFSFDDTDVYKTIEGASYLLQTYPDEKLKNYIDSVLVIVAGAQEPDGYLYTARTMNPKHPHEWAGSKRWEKVEELSHEFYNLGHMLEAAVAHYQATGQRNFLDIAIRYADCVIREVGPNPGQVVRVPGHQIAEMGLAKLYLATGDKKYLDQAKFFLDYRGKTEHRDPYNQTHLPVLEQKEAVGHAVRATYMYAGMADVAALTGDQGYIHAIDTIWDNIVSKKMYITGGIGSTNDGEAFGANYELPNATAYNETCAAIGNQDAGDAVIAFLNLKLLEVTELDLAGHIGMETVGYAVIPAGNGGIVCFQLDMPGFPVGLRGVKAVYAVHRFAASGNGAALEFRTEQGVFHLCRLRLRRRHFQRGKRYFFERGIQLGQKRL